MDTDPFHIQTNYIEPMQIMMMGALIGTTRVGTPLSEEEVNPLGVILPISFPTTLTLVCAAGHPATILATTFLA